MSPRDNRWTFSVLVGVLCHEAAGAWVAIQQHSERSGGPFREDPVEQANDEASRAKASEAAVYLGFGVPATNAADSTRHTGSLEGTVVTTSWGVTSAGGLSVQSMVYLLAVQAAVRDRKDELKLIRKGLHTNQCADFNGWIEQLSEQRAELLERLAIGTAAGCGRGARGRRRTRSRRVRVTETRNQSTQRAWLDHQQTGRRGLSLEASSCHSLREF